MRYVRSTHRSLPFFFEPTSATGTKRSVFPRASCRYVYPLFGYISRQRRSWGEKAMGKQAGIDDSGDPLWASLIQNRVRDNTHRAPSPAPSAVQPRSPACAEGAATGAVGSAPKIEGVGARRRAPSGVSIPSHCKRIRKECGRQPTHF